MTSSPASRSDCHTCRSRKPSASSTRRARRRNAATSSSARSSGTRRRESETYMAPEYGGPAMESPSTRAEGLDGLREEYLRALLAPDARRARALVDAAADDGVPVQRLYVAVLEPAMARIGRLWEEARISVAQEHMATQITQAVLAPLALRLTGAA